MSVKHLMLLPGWRGLAKNNLSQCAELRDCVRNRAEVGLPRDAHVCVT